MLRHGDMGARDFFTLKDRQESQGQFLRPIASCGHIIPENSKAMVIKTGGEGRLNVGSDSVGGSKGLALFFTHAPSEPSGCYSAH